jgi:uncharacterized protein (TIGR00297 family)
MAVPGEPPRPELTPELVRKGLHIGAGFTALLLRDGGFWVGVGIALFGLLLAEGIVPKLLGRRLWRQREHEAGGAPAFRLFPLAFLGVLLLFSGRLEVVAATWALLAFGDGAAALVGRWLPLARLPWNVEKSWGGFLACALAGGAGVVGLVAWTAPGAHGSTRLWVAGALCGLLAAGLESVPERLDDNLRVPFVPAFVLLAVLKTEPAHLLAPQALQRLALGACGVAACAALGFGLRAMRASGAVAGWALGSLVFWALGLAGFALLATFVVVAVALTRLGYARKAALGLAESSGGRRGAAHALANLVVPGACALFAALIPGEPAYRLAFVGALAVALADTAGTEAGKLWGRRAVSPLSLREVAPGTPGAVSFPGTLAGALAAAALGTLGAALGLVPVGAVWIVALAGTLASLAESLLSALAPERPLLSHHALNLANTFVGAVVAGWAAKL